MSNSTIRLRLRSRQDDYFDLTIEQEGRVIFGPALGRRDLLPKAYRAVRDCMVEIKDASQDATLTLGQCARQIQKLVDEGTVYAVTVLPNHGPAFLNAWSELLSSLDGDDAPRTIEVDSDLDSVFLAEIIPAGTPASLVPATDGELVEIAMLLPLYSCVVRHLRVVEFGNAPGGAGFYQSGINQDSQLVGSTAMLLWNETLEQRVTQRAMLEHHGLSVNGPFPNSEQPPQGTDREAAARWLAARIAAPPVLGSGEVVPIVHICGHSELTAQPSPLSRHSQIELARQGLGSRGWFHRTRPERFFVMNGYITSVSTARRRAGEVMLRGPVAVLSSCEGVAEPQELGLSIAGALLGAGYRAVVGAETKIGDLTATWFFERFYQYLFEQRVSIGEAARAARVDLLRGRSTVPHATRGRTALGILFRVYGDATLTFDAPEAKLSDAAAFPI